MTTQEIITRRAPRGATSWNAETLTFDAVLATGAPVQRHDARGAYDEILDLTKAAFAPSIPLLDSHARDTLDAVLGRVENIAVVGGELRGRAVLSRNNPRAQRVAAELTDGETFGISIGYVVSKWTERTNPATKRREKIATELSIVESSIVVIAADANAGIRTMEHTETQSPHETQDAGAVAERAAINAEIRAIAKVAGLGQDFVDGQIDAGASADAARAGAFEAMRSRSHAGQIRTTASVGMDYGDPEFRSRAIGEALFTRVAPSHTPSEQARQFVGLSIPEIARDCLRTRGFQTTGLSSASVVERALQTTSDFPLILGDTVGRTLRMAYESAPAGVRRLARQTTARDFRAKHRIQLSSAPTLEAVNEHGEFKSGALAEAQESYKVDTFGRIIGVSRQALVNDDLGAFADLTRRMGQAAAAFEAGFLVNLLTSNPLMSDGVALFHATHANLAATPAAINDASLTAARKAMRTQKGLLNEAISVTPKFLLVSPDKEVEAEKMVAAITPASSTDVNPFASKLEIIVEPRLSGNAWYLVADPSEIDGLEYAYLEGAAGPQVTSEVGFDIDAIRFRVRLDFGAGFVDWRGWHKNAGA